MPRRARPTHCALPRSPRCAAALSLLLALFAWGCQGEEDATPNRLPLSGEDTEADTDGALDTTVDPDAVVSACDCLKVGDWYRFDTLAVTALDGQKRHPIVSVLNALWEADIARQELNVLFEVTALDDASVTFRAVNAARLNDDLTQTCLLPYTAVEMVFARQGCALAMTESSSLNIYAGSQSIPKNCGPSLAVPHTIPVYNVKLTMNLSATCDAITDGVVAQAALSELELGSICTCSTAPDQSAEWCCANHDPNNPDPNCPAVSADYQDPNGRCNGCGETFNNLLDLLKQFGALPFKCVAPDGSKAVCLDAKFAGARVPLAPASCVTP
jgi:hypothetical protein